MSLSILSIKDVFPNVFTGTGAATSFTYETICKMLTVEDSFNSQASYKLNSSFESSGVASSTYEKDGNAFTLYVKKQDEQGNDIFEQVTNPETLIPTTTELYLKKKLSNEYVRMYDLVVIDMDRISANVSDATKRDSGFCVAALIYAVSCLRNRMVLLCVNEMEMVSVEQEKLVNAMNALTRTVNDISAADRGSDDKNNTAIPDLDAVAFMAQRDLLMTTESVGVITKVGIETIRAYANNPTSGNKSAAQTEVNKWNLTHDKTAAIRDALRVYVDRVGNDLAARSTTLNMHLQLAQQDIQTASSLLSAVEQFQGGAVGFIR
jgi:hypothetical protein